MNLQLADLFGYFSVLLRAATLVLQSLLLGGVLFLLWVARQSPDARYDGLETVQSFSLRLFRTAAVVLAVVQVLYLYVNSTVLMGTADVVFRDVVGANFFLAGTGIFVAAVLGFAVSWMPQNIRAVCLALAVAVVLSASLMTNHAAARLDNRPLLIVITTIHEAATGILDRRASISDIGPLEGEEWPRSLVALETGTHSPWVSRLLTELGHQVIVAHAQKVELITKSNRKDDRHDARTLVRLARIDPELLGRYGIAARKHKLI